MICVYISRLMYKLITPKFNKKMKSDEIVMLSIPIIILLYMLYLLFIHLFDNVQHLSQVVDI